MDKSTLKAIEQGVIDVCHEVGGFILQEGAGFDQSKIEQKTDFNNLVSYVDKEAERKLVTRLRALLPQASFITEEGTVENSHKGEYHWIIDPLDGTTNFLHGLPVFSISVGLTRHNKGILGVVHDMSRNECFHTIEEEPARCNGKEIRVSAATSLQESLLATGFPYHHLDKKEAYLEIIKAFLERTRGIRRLGSAAIDLAYVACGRFDGYFEYNLNPWDVAGGTLLVQQAGGKVTDFTGNDNFLFGGQMCASNGGNLEEMLALIQQHWFTEKERGKI